MKVRLSDVKRIAKLSRYPIKKLRKMNRELDRTYNGEELNRWELIFQIVFYVDAPKK
jgi:hypothetical protein